MSERCATCKWWDATEPLIVDRMYGKIDNERCRCGHDEIVAMVGSVDKNDEYYYPNGIYTHIDFGCVLWEDNGALTAD